MESLVWPYHRKHVSLRKKWFFSNENYFDEISVTNRQLFFHALASAAESRIPLSVLDNMANWPTSNPVTNPNQFVVWTTKFFNAHSNPNPLNYRFSKWDCVKPHKLPLRVWTTMEICSLERFIHQALDVGIQRLHTIMQIWDWLLGMMQHCSLLVDLKLWQIRMDHKNCGCWVADSKWEKKIISLFREWKTTETFFLKKIMAGTRNLNEINYRVQRIPIYELLNGSTRCNGVALPRRP